MNNHQLRRRWVDGRTGHATYLIFALTLVNFVLIAHRFLIEREPSLFEGLISDLLLFGSIFLITYIPISIIIGFWHRKTQLSVDNSIKFLEHPYFSMIFRMLLDTQTGRASKEEIDEFRKILLNIEKK